MDKQTTLVVDDTWPHRKPHEESTLPEEAGEGYHDCDATDNTTYEITPVPAPPIFKRRGKPRNDPTHPKNAFRRR